MYFHNKALDLHLTTMTVKQVASFHAPPQSEDTEQQVMNKHRVKHTTHVCNFSSFMSQSTALTP